MGTVGRLARFKAAVNWGGVPQADWRSPLLFLPAETVTVALVLWAAGRFLAPGISWSRTSLVAVLAWCAVIAGSAALERKWVRHLGGALRALALALGVTAVFWVAMMQADHLDWLQAAGIGLI